MPAKNIPLIEIDEYLAPYRSAIALRIGDYKKKHARLLNGKSIRSFANGHLYFGLHRTADGFVFREHLPCAKNVWLTGDFNNWDRRSHRLTKLPGGNFEIVINDKNAFREGQRLLMDIETESGEHIDRSSAYSMYLWQHPETRVYDGCVYFSSYKWKHKKPDCRPDPLLIYECHVGMAQEKQGIGTYREFADRILPRIVASGYNTVQLMAVQEHPYYASFGYQVSFPFAVSNRFGTPDDLKYLIDTAHGLGLHVLLDLVHSHSAPNERDGICNMDGSGSFYCSGSHPAWGSRLFDYSRDDTIHYLLSNIKYWMTEFRFDGFRFDGITSMIYHDHALGKSFTGYPDYFTANTNTAALTYLTLASELIHKTDPNAIMIAEDMSGYPGMCIPIKQGGIGFDYRLNMGVPDLWIKLIKEKKEWHMGKLWYELSQRRKNELTVGYSESHDQALVGDQTIIFRLLGADMYSCMDNAFHRVDVDNGIALEKLIRLITIAAASDGYLNFMGNEFAHPEWVDFPRDGNGGSFNYARRQWSLADNGFLKYGRIGAFDREMLRIVSDNNVLNAGMPSLISVHEDDKLLFFERGGLQFLFNFHPTKSYEAKADRNTELLLDSDEERFCGFGRTWNKDVLRIPPLCAVVLKKK